MRPSSVLLALTVIFLMYGGKLSSVTANKNQTPVSPKTCDKMMVCNCNVNQDSRVSEAIKGLETNMQQLIALVNKTLALQPTTTPGKLRFFKNSFG